MRLTLLSAVFALVATTATAQTNQQFDLMCRGTLDVYNRAGGSLIRTYPLDNRYRLDLDQRVWCVNDCQDLKDIGEVTSTRIVLTESGRAISLTVDRLTGEMTGVRDLGILRREIKLSCTLLPYSAMPAPAS